MLFGRAFERAHDPSNRIGGFSAAQRHSFSAEPM
jgi:hypothetical protein